MSRPGTFAVAAAKRHAGRIARGVAQTSADFRVDNHGSIVVLNALTPEALAWVEEHLPGDRQTWGTNGTVVEPRYLGAIINGITNDGLTAVGV